MVRTVCRCRRWGGGNVRGALAPGHPGDGLQRPRLVGWGGAGRSGRGRRGRSRPGGGAVVTIYAREDSLPNMDVRGRVVLRARVARSFRPPTRPAPRELGARDLPAGHGRSASSPRAMWKVAGRPQSPPPGDAVPPGHDCYWGRGTPRRSRQRPGARGDRPLHVERPTEGRSTSWRATRPNGNRPAAGQPGLESGRAVPRAPGSRRRGHRIHLRRPVRAANCALTLSRPERCIAVHAGEVSHTPTAWKEAPSTSSRGCSRRHPSALFCPRAPSASWHLAQGRVHACWTREGARLGRHRR